MQDAPPGEPVAGLIYGLPPLATARLAPALMGPDGASKTSVFIAASDLKMVVSLEARSWVGSVGAVRIGVAVIPGRVITLFGFGVGDGAPGGEVDGRSAEPALGASLLAETESGEPVLLEGGTVRAVGRFEELGGAAITWEDEIIERLDVTALYRWIEKQVWERSALVGPHGARIATPEKEVGVS